MNNILIFTNTYKPVLGGVQTVTSQIAEESNVNSNIKVYTNKHPSNLKFFGKIKNVSIFRFHLGNRYAPVNSVKSFLIRLFAILIFPFTFFHLFVLFLMHKPNVVNVHFPLHQIRYVSLLKKIFTFKLVVSFHGHDVLQWEEKEKTNLFKNQLNMIKMASDVSACSNYLARKVEDIYSLEDHVVKTVYNGVDLEVFKKKSKTSYDGLFIFTFGRLEFHKGFDLLIEAFAKLEKKNLKLLIAGNGLELESLSKQVSELKLEERIVFLGRINQDEIASYASKALLNVIPSRREPFGIVVLEALAAKKILVATNVGGIPEILDERFGILVQPTTDGLYRGILEGLSDLVQAPEGEIEDYLKSFSIDNMIMNYNKLWK
jgi:glycosyltransferase involved in cell wall biosynthesis